MPALQSILGFLSCNVRSVLKVDSAPAGPGPRALEIEAIGADSKQLDRNSKSLTLLECNYFGTKHTALSLAVG